MRDELKLQDGLDTEGAHALHLRLLQGHVRDLAERSPYYKDLFQRSGFVPKDLKDISDLQHLPLTGNKELEAHHERMLCVPKKRIIDHVTTSGTTGAPVPIMLTELDLQRLAANEHNSLLMAGATEDDVIQLMTTMDRRFMAGLAYFLGVRSLGAGIVRLGPGAASLQWESMQRFGSTVLVAVPSFLVRLLEDAEQHGIDPSTTAVRKAICIGEPIHDALGEWNNIGQRIKERWDIELIGTYASTEMATACTERWEGSGHHVQSQLVYVEVLGTDGKAVMPGGTGEVVVTPFHVEGMPLLRYRTGDICTVYEKPMHGQWQGQGTWLGPVLGRQQQRLKVKGTTLFPTQLVDPIAAFRAITNFVVICRTDALGGDELEVLVDLPEGRDGVDGPIGDELRERLKDHVRVTPKVTAATNETINRLKWPKNSRKPRLFVDQRTGQFAQEHKPN